MDPSSTTISSQDSKSRVLESATSSENVDSSIPTITSEDSNPNVLESATSSDSSPQDKCGNTSVSASGQGLHDEFKSQKLKALPASPVASNISSSIPAAQDAIHDVAMHPSKSPVDGETGQGSLDKFKSPELKALSAPSVANSNVSSSLPAAKDATPDLALDPSKSPVDGKTDPRYNALEAVSTVKDPNGSDITAAIIGFIEKKFDELEAKSINRVEESMVEKNKKLEKDITNLKVRLQSLDSQPNSNALKTIADLIEKNSMSSPRQTQSATENPEPAGKPTPRDICKQHTEIVAGFRNDVPVLLNCFIMVSALLLVCDEKVFFLSLVIIAGVALLISFSSAMVNMFTTRNMLFRDIDIEANSRDAILRVMRLEMIKLIAFFVLTSMYLIYITVHSCSERKGPPAPAASPAPPNNILPVLGRRAYWYTT